MCFLVIYTKVDFVSSAHSRETFSPAVQQQLAKALLVEQRYHFLIGENVAQDLLQN